MTKTRRHPSQRPVQFFRPRPRARNDNDLPDTGDCGWAARRTEPCGVCDGCSYRTAAYPDHPSTLSLEELAHL